MLVEQAQRRQHIVDCKWHVSATFPNVSSFRHRREHTPVDDPHDGQSRVSFFFLLFGFSGSYSRKRLMSMRRWVVEKWEDRGW